MDLSEYIRRATEIASSYTSLRSRLEEYGDTLLSSLRKYGEIVVLDDEVRYVFVGDLHGDLIALKEILRIYREEHLKQGSLRMVFLGDYVDRGSNQLEVLVALLELKRDYPESVLLLKGNHEGVDILEPSPHDFPEELISRYLISRGLEIYRLVVDVIFKNLHLAAYLKEHFLALHGGLPTATYRKTQVLREYLLGSTQEALRNVIIEALWNDPVETSEEAYESPRGAGMLFGRPVTEWVTKTFKVKLVVRGHEPCARGYKFNHGNRVLTLFSRTGPPYYNLAGAFLEIDTSNREWYRLVREAEGIKFVRSADVK